MLCKSQCFDMSSCFRIPTPVNPIRVSISPIQTHFSANKIPELLEIPNEGHKKFPKFRKNNINPSAPLEKKPGNLRLNPRGSDGSGPELVEEQSGKSFYQSGIEDKASGHVSYRSKKVHTRCSTKWASYGGYITNILRALESTSDLDEAFRPWEDRLSNKERSIVLKEQLSWERAMEIFEWFKRKGCYEVNVIHYNIMLRILGKARKWRLVEDLWDEMRVKDVRPINSTFGTLIDVYTKGGLREEAIVWVQRMSEHGMEPDEVTMGIIIQMYKKGGEYEKAEEFFKMWSLCKPRKEKTVLRAKSDHGASKVTPRVHLSLSLYTYNTLIDTYGKAGRLEEMSQTFQKILDDGAIPDTITFNTMIHIYGNSGMFDEVDSLVRKMEELKCTPDTRTYNILISLYAKRDDIDVALSYLIKMKAACLEPNIVSYRTLLYALSMRHIVSDAEILISEMDKRGLKLDEFTQSALTRMYIDASMLEKAWSWFERFHLEGNMSSECYSANIDAFGERGYVDEAEKVFMYCRERKKVGVVEFNVMIKAYGIGKKYDKACKLFNRMEEFGVFPDRCSYISLIHLLASADLPHIAKPYLLKMQEAGLVNDCVQYCALISSFVKQGKMELAKSLYKEMIGYNVHPDIVVYGVLINAFADDGNVTEAMDCMDSLRNNGFSLNEVICNSLIKLYTKVGYLVEAEETYRLLQSFEKSKDGYASNCMIDLYTKRSMVKEAEETFEDVRKKGVANEFSFAMMLCMYKRIGRVEEAVKIAKQMHELGLLTELLSYNSVLSLFSSVGRSKEAVGIFKEMIKHEIEPDDSSFKSLGVVLVKSGVPKKAVAKLEVERKRNARVGLLEWTSALTSVVSGEVVTIVR